MGPPTVNEFGPSAFNSSPKAQQSNVSYESVTSGATTPRQQPNLSYQNTNVPSTRIQQSNLSYESSFHDPALRTQLPENPDAYTQSFPSGLNQQRGASISGPGPQQTSNLVERSYAPEKSGYSFGASAFSGLFSWAQAEPGT
jgi:hypothetical protein